jgi:proline iminopeptidase
MALYRFETPVRDDYLAVPGARLYVREVGVGTPLVVLHGGPDFNHHYLLPELDRLSAALRLIYYDQRGRGKSSPGVDPEDVSIDSEVADLEHIRRHLGLEAISLLGHSWGGVLAMEYAVRHPDRVAGLILMNSAPASYADRMIPGERSRAADAESRARMRSIAETPEYAAGNIAVEAEYYREHFRAAVRRPEDLERVVGSLRVHFSPEDIVKARAIESRLYAQTWDLPGYDLLAMLRRTRPRMLVIHGEHDIIPLECAINVAAAVPGARLVVLEDCGHFAFLDRPAEVFDAIADFSSRT